MEVEVCSFQGGVSYEGYSYELSRLDWLTRKGRKEEKKRRKQVDFLSIYLSFRPQVEMSSTRCHDKLHHYILGRVRTQARHGTDRCVL